jgi:hypothetical protein
LLLRGVCVITCTSPAAGEKHIESERTGRYTPRIIRQRGGGRTGGTERGTAYRESREREMTRGGDSFYKQDKKSEGNLAKYSPQR